MKNEFLFLGIGVVWIGLIIGFLGFFHIFTDHHFLIPKEHFTFSRTFITIEEVLKRYNNRALGERMRGDVLLDHLVSELQIRDYISTTEVKPFTEEQLGF